MRTRALLLAAATALGACSSSSSDGTPPPAELPPAPPAPNTGFVAFAVAGGEAKLYTPAPRREAPGAPDDGWQPIAVLDPAAPNGADAVVRYVDLGLGIEPEAVGADGADVVVVDGSSPTVFFVDAATDTVKGDAPLPPGAERFFVSGTNMYASGAAVDAARRRAWVSFSGGIAEYDLDARALTTTYPAPPSENFAYHQAAGVLYVPFYLCDPNGQSGGCDPYAPNAGPDLTDSVTVVNLASRATYALVGPVLVGAANPLGFEPDGAAIDPGLGIVAVVAEAPPALQLLRTTPQYDLATLTCTAPVAATIPLPADKYSAVTVDATTHLAVVAQENVSGIALVDLTLARPWPGHRLLFSIPDKPNGEAWATRADPHGVTVGVVGGRPYAFVTQKNRRWVARIDLEAAAALATADQAAFAAAVSFSEIPATPPR